MCEKERSKMKAKPQKWKIVQTHIAELTSAPRRVHCTHGHKINIRKWRKCRKRLMSVRVCVCVVCADADSFTMPSKFREPVKFQLILVLVAHKMLQNARRRNQLNVESYSCSTNEHTTIIITFISCFVSLTFIPLLLLLCLSRCLFRSRSMAR